MVFTGYVIHLSYREDRKKSFENSCHTSGWPLHRIKYINTIGNKDKPLHDCRQTHADALQTAMDDNMKWFAIFEDDVILRPNIKKTIVKTIQHIPNDAGCVLLGCNIVINTNFIKEFDGIKMFSFERFTGSHAILYNTKTSNLFQYSLMFNDIDLVENIISDTLLDNHLKGYIITPFATDFIRKQNSSIRDQYVEDTLTEPVEQILYSLS